MSLALLFLSLLSIVSATIERKDVVIYELFFKLNAAISDYGAAAIGCGVVLLFNLIPLLVVLILHRVRRSKRPTKKQRKAVDKMKGKKFKKNAIKDKQPKPIKPKGKEPVVNQKASVPKLAAATEFKFEGNEQKRHGNFDVANSKRRITNWNRFEISTSCQVIMTVNCLFSFE
ncbi:hypothetical protein M3Y94_01108300 [Aphelenchoides besseyi]|nr:hypothetical protein M3Y94_01108300 [Aphelenchoides besseyi]